jgi:2-amino-4-hydroxy-6-hydroxymethyldihydropteridine diphosphokinase
MARVTAFIGFGSNVGNRLDFCGRAVTLLNLLPHSEVTGVSPLYETEPVNDGANPGEGWFLNGVVRIETDVTPRSLLSVCREIERSLGRDEDHRKGPRTLDLDILFYGQQVIEEPDLIVPHPRLPQRRFVLAPMSDVDPEWSHPVLHRTIVELLADTTDQSAVRRVDSPPWSQYSPRPTCSQPPVP